MRGWGSNPQREPVFSQVTYHFALCIILYRRVVPPVRLERTRLSTYAPKAYAYQPFRQGGDFFCAHEEIRTPTSFRTPASETGASANSATRAIAPRQVRPARWICQIPSVQLVHESRCDTRPTLIRPRGGFEPKAGFEPTTSTLRKWRSTN